MAQSIDKQTSAEISEIFSSRQGEGPYLGVKQVFVRFGRCNMRCVYCDEVENMKEENFSKRSMTEVLTAVERLEKEKGEHHSVSLTGGEPLFYAPFLENFLPQLKKRGFRIYLETNGTLPRELERILKWCDVIAMDWKPSSSTQDRSFEKEHEQFLKIALRREVFVKVVITPETKEEEIRRVIEFVKSISPRIPFIFQPLSDPFGINMLSMDLIEKKLAPLAHPALNDVRIIPQMHKIWGVR